MYCRRIGDNLNCCMQDQALFESDLMVQDACCMCVVQIGELAARLSDDVRAKNPSIPWREIKDTRNFYVHNYGAIDVPMVWETVTNDIPLLLRACEAILGD